MTESEKPPSLSEEDYLAILDVITRFNQCETRDDLKKTFQSRLLSLLKAQGGVYIWVDSEVANAQIVDSINIPTPNINSFRDYLAYDNLGNSCIAKARPVMIFDAENNFLETKAGTDKFFKENSNYDRKQHAYLDQVEGALVTIDLPDTYVGVGIHRLTPCSDLWTPRDIRVFELLRPHFLQSIKTIVLREELEKHRSLAKKLCDVPTPVALMNETSRVVFHNRAFEELGLIKTGQRISGEFFHLIHKEITRYDPPYDIENSQFDLPFLNLSQGKYRLSLSKINGNNRKAEDLWLLRLKPAIEPYSKLNILMQEAGLTGREMEIAILVRDGMGDQGIADRLFLSIHTVKNHLKSIYKKLKVHTRAQLVASLNQ